MNEKTESGTTINVDKSVVWIKENYKVVIQTVFICTAIVLSYVIGRFAMGYEITTIKDFCEQAVGMRKLSINESTYTITVNPPPKLAVNGSELTGIFGQG
jgi:regulatory protein YycH of two-component signal transduction system YycFG